MFILSLLPLLDLALLEADSRVLIMRLWTFLLLGDFVAVKGVCVWGGGGGGRRMGVCGKEDK